MTLTASHRADVASPTRATGARKDIQALRALAVLSVVVYHLWPGALPGGFVGVDVFFVISGYLITTHLISHPPRRLGDLVTFWGRRALRLLPPVVLVILVILVASLLFMSSGQWQRMATEAITSMFYVENWRLIADATDYLDANRAPSPFQHFWSLSVEEQYYVAWPFVVALVALATRRAGHTARRRGYALVFGVLLLASLVYSVWLTQAVPSEAYFSTFTRVWELAVGSLLAACYPWLTRHLDAATTRAVLLWAGLGGILVALTTFDESMAFPGWVALLPTCATALVILARDPDHRSNPRAVSHARATQVVGDTSYAMYLWHWPLIVLAPYVLDHAPGTSAKIAVLGASVCLAWVSTHLLENPVRRAPVFRDRPGRALAVGAIGSVVVLVAAGALHLHVSREVEANRERVQSQLASPKSCLGAAALDPERSCSADQPLVTSPEFAKADITDGILGCLNWVPFPDPLVQCQDGDTTSPRKRIALFGNSHAGHWLEAMSKLGRRHHWQVDTYIVGVCKSTVVPQPVDTSIGASTEECARIQSEVVEDIANGPYDLVVMSTLDRDPTSTPELYRSTIEGLTATGKHLLVIRDTPAPLDPDNEPPDCVARHEDDLAACAGTPATWIGADPLAEEASRIALTDDDVSVVGLNQYICSPTVCPAVVGGVIVYSDFNHMTKTFSTTLAPYLAPAVKAALR